MLIFLKYSKKIIKRLSNFKEVIEKKLIFRKCSAVFTLKGVNAEIFRYNVRTTLGGFGYGYRKHSCMREVVNSSYFAFQVALM